MKTRRDRIAELLNKRIGLLSVYGRPMTPDEVMDYAVKCTPDAVEMAELRVDIDIINERLGIPHD